MLRSCGRVNVNKRWRNETKQRPWRTDRSIFKDDEYPLRIIYVVEIKKRRVSLAHCLKDLFSLNGRKSSGCSNY
uniref:Uncharacterized protein n=1 Tax=Arundo donax TaxID=35708 RepID=A0A0A8ZPU0_ARUDO